MDERIGGWTGDGLSVIDGVRELVEVMGTPTAEVDADAVDTAYVAKYGASGASSMVTAEAAASTLLLTPAAGA